MFDATRIIFIRLHAGQASKLLNRRGELLAQHAIIWSDLYSRTRSRYSPFLLRLQYAIALDCQHRWAAMKRLLLHKDKGLYLTELEHASEVSKELSFPWLVRWLVFFATACGKLGRIFVTRLVLEKRPPGMKTAKSG
jgi:hypothetical protein